MIWRYFSIIHKFLFLCRDKSNHYKTEYTPKQSSCLFFSFFFWQICCPCISFHLFNGISFSSSWSGRKPWNHSLFCLKFITHIHSTFKIYQLSNHFSTLYCYRSGSNCDLNNLPLTYNHTCPVPILIFLSPASQGDQYLFLFLLPKLWKTLSLKLQELLSSGHS